MILRFAFSRYFKNTLFQSCFERLKVTAECGIHALPEFRLVWGEGKADFLQQQKGGVFQPLFPNSLYTTEAVGLIHLKAPCSPLYEVFEAVMELSNASMCWGRGEKKNETRHIMYPLLFLLIKLVT